MTCPIPDNVLHLVFSQYDAVVRHDTISYVRKNGGNWSVPIIADSDYAGSIQEIDLGTGANGSPLLVGRNYDYVGSKEQVFFSMLVNGVWSTLETITSGPGEMFTTVRVGADASGIPVVAYSRRDTWNAYLTRRLTDGTWSSSVIANTAAQQVGQMDVAVDTLRNKLYLPYTVNISGHGEIFFNTADLSGDFVAPSIALASLAGVLALVDGSTHELSWDASDDRAVASVSLKYTVNGGATYTAIVDGLSASGSYLWTIPDVVAGSVQVVALATDTSGNQGTAQSVVFSLIAKKLTSVEILGPGMLDEGTTGSYQVYAHYDNGESAVVSAPLSLMTTPYATLSGSIVTAKSVAATTAVTLNASYAEGGVTKTVGASVTIRDVPQLPGAPTGVTAVAGRSQARISFTAPTSNGGSAITSYTVTASPGGLTASDSGSPITISGLHNGMAYTFTVRAYNAAGKGTVSMPSASVMGTVSASDFNNDGKSDLTWMNTDGSYALWLMNGTSLLSSAVYGPYSGWSLLSGDADFNNDGMSDLLWRNSNGTASIWLMNGTTQQSHAEYGPYSGWTLVSGNNDFNGDGKADLLWTNANGAASIWLMDGITLLSTVVFGPYPGWTVVSGGNDFNGDGKSDLLWKNSNGAASIWLMNGVTQLGNAGTYGPYPGWTVVSGTSDYNGDGMSDLLWQNTNGAASIWLMNGTTQQGVATFGPYTGWSVVPGRRDYNADGKSDLLWSNSNGASSIWLMNGTAQQGISTYGPFPGWSILGGRGDYNGDGMTDLLWQNTNGAASIWLMNGTTQQGVVVHGPYPGWTPMTGTTVP